MFIENLKLFLRDNSYLLFVALILFIVSGFASSDAKAEDSFRIDQEEVIA
jgi:hypothetical protein